MLGQLLDHPKHQGHWAAWTRRFWFPKRVKMNKPGWEKDPRCVGIHFFASFTQTSPQTSLSHYQGSLVVGQGMKPTSTSVESSTKRRLTFSKPSMRRMLPVPRQRRLWFRLSLRRLHSPRCWSIHLRRGDYPHREYRRKARKAPSQTTFPRRRRPFWLPNNSHQRLNCRCRPSPSVDVALVGPPASDARETRERNFTASVVTSTSLALLRKR